MTKPSHTPICFNCGNKGEIHSFRRSLKVVYWCGPCIENAAWQESAAPDMLEALETFLLIYPDKVRNHPDVRIAITKAEDAIAKAKGGK